VCGRSPQAEGAKPKSNYIRSHLFPHGNRIIIQFCVFPPQQIKPQANQFHQDMPEANRRLDDRDNDDDDDAAPPKKKQKRNKPTLSCSECVDRKTKVSRRRRRRNPSSRPADG